MIMSDEFRTAKEPAVSAVRRQLEAYNRRDVAASPEVYADERRQEQ